MRWLIAILILLLTGLQYRLWIAPGSFAEVAALKRELAEQQVRNDRLAGRNALLAEEVRELKQGLGAVEARARSELGMIREGETFYLVVEKPRP